MKVNRKYRRVLVAVSMIAGVMLQANAASIYWNGAGEDANWSNSTNWAGNVKPGAVDIAYIGSSVLKQAETEITQFETCKQIVMATVAESQVRLTIVDGGLTVSAVIDVGSTAAGIASEGSIVHSNGTVVVGDYLLLGRNLLSTGSYELVSGLLDTKTLHVGYDGGNGTFVQRGGDVVVNAFMFVGYQGEGSGRYELHGGTLSTGGDEYVGVGGGTARGDFLQSGGTNMPTALIIGHSAGNTGEYRMCGGELRVMRESSTTIGYSGQGVLTQSGGTVTVEKYVYVGRLAGSEGVYQLSGGNLQFTNACYVIVGVGGRGTFQLGDADGSGTFVKGSSDANFYIRNSENGDGTLEGWGAMPDLYLQNNGRVIADGYGTERTLDLSTLKTLGNKNPGLAYTSTHGWFARNRGALRLKDIGAGANFYWGDNASSSGQTVTNQPLVNSVKFVCTGASGTLTGRLLATDHTDVRPGLERPLSVWDFSGVTHTTADVTIRYDDLAATASNVTSANLRLFQHDGTGWHNRTVSIDPVTKTITASLISPVSQLAVASIRPGTLLMVQ